MLDWIWFSILVLAGLVCAVVATACAGDSESGFGEMGFVLASFALMALSLVVSSAVTISPVCEWLYAALPERGAPVNQFTALALIGVACVMFVFAVPFAVAMAAYQYRDLSSASSIARRAIDRARAPEIGKEESR